jgi:hypothetical protein
MIDRVKGDIDVARIVRVGRLDLCDKILVEEELSDVRD